MAQLSATLFLTLDGVYQAPGGPEEDTTGGFDLGGWLAPLVDDDFGAFVDENFRHPTAFLLGRRTYEIFASYWPKQTDPGDPVAGKLNALPKYVASTTLENPEWAGTTVIGREDLVKEVAALKKSTEGEIQVHGSGALLGQLLKQNLVDVLHLIVAPVALGKGMRLFGAGTAPTAFTLTGSRTTSQGVAILSYRYAGQPQFGTVGE